MSNNGNEFLPNYVEHLCPLQESKMLFSKKLGITSLALLLLCGVFYATTFSFLQFFGGMIPFALLGIGFLVWYLWRFVSVEFEYTILGGEISFEVIYGRRQRKPFYTAKLQSVEKIAPVNGKEIKANSFPGVTRELFCASTYSNPNTYYAIIQEEGGGKTLLFFEVSQKAEKALRFYAGRAFLG